MGAKGSEDPDSTNMSLNDGGQGLHYRSHDVSDEPDGQQRTRNWGVSRFPFRGPLPEHPGQTVPDADERAVLLAAYDQVGATWRALTDVRFKLLGLLPAFSVIALSQVLRNDTSSTLPKTGKLLTIALGAAVAAGLWIYDMRNNELYDELISRGRRIEAELGIHTGAYLGRPGSRRHIINHKTALRLVYGTTLLGWLAAIVVVATT